MMHLFELTLRYSQGKNRKPANGVCFPLPD